MQNAMTFGHVQTDQAFCQGITLDELKWFGRYQVLKVLKTRLNLLKERNRSNTLLQAILL